MKLIYAGIGEAALPYTSLLFNCTRNRACQSEFFVPVNLFSDIQFYADLVGSPSLVEIEVLNACNVAEIGSAVSGSFVVGQKPGGTWYGVFGGLVVTPPMGVTFTKFFFRFTFTIGGQEYVFYSEMYEFPVCGQLMFIRGCYPNEPVGSEAVDCNGIYYGFPTNEDFLGSQVYRYYHSAFIRMATIIEQANKMTISAFNSKKTYKTVFERESILEFEFVPTFYKNVMIGVFIRGNVQLGGTEYRLAESQDIRIIDKDSKLWKVDIVLAEECEQTFGCGPADCLPPPEPCNLPEITPSIVEHEDPGVWVLSFSPTSGIFLEWEIYDRDMLLVDSDDTDGANADPNSYWLDTISPDTDCYTVRWRIRCGTPGNYYFSEWSEPFQFGDCSTPPTLYRYECERFLCSYCPEPFDTVVLISHNPSLTLFKYYKQLATPSTVTVRPIATSMAVGADYIVGIARDTCVQSCNDELPPPIEPD